MIVLRDGRHVLVGPDAVIFDDGIRIYRRSARYSDFPAITDNAAMQGQTASIMTP